MAPSSTSVGLNSSTVQFADQTAITKQTADDYEAKIAKIHTAYAGAQEATVQAVTQSTKEGVANDYESKISAIRTLYAGRLRSAPSAGGGHVPGLSLAAPPAYDHSSYDLLAANCAVTTQMLLSLQGWVSGQEAVK